LSAQVRRATNIISSGAGYCDGLVDKACQSSASSSAARKTIRMATARPSISCSGEEVEPGHRRQTFSGRSKLKSVPATAVPRSSPPTMMRFLLPELIHGLARIRVRAHRRSLNRKNPPCLERTSTKFGRPSPPKKVFRYMLVKAAANRFELLVECESDRARPVGGLRVRGLYRILDFYELTCLLSACRYQRAAEFRQRRRPR
jgi:hypothetical protein